MLKNMFSLYMASVPSLIEFYNNQNSLATRVSEATAANKTSANIESARIGQDAKRLAQEKQLEFFRQKMEDLRNQRSTTSAERMALSEQTARQQAAILSQEFSGSQNAANQDFNLRLQQLQDENANARADKQIGANIELEDRRDANTLAREEYKTEQGADQAQADLEYKRAQTADVGRAKPSTREDLIKQLNEAEKLPSAWYDSKDKKDFKDRLVESIKKDLSSMGENPDMIPEVLAAKAPAVAAKAKALADGLENDFAQYAQDGRIQKATKLISDYQDAIASGRVNSPATKKAIEARLQAKLNALKVTAADITKIKKMYSLD